MCVPLPDDGGGRAPLLLLASRLLLTRKFGEQGWIAVDKALGQLSESLHWLPARLLYVDDERCLSPYGLTAVYPREPEGILSLVRAAERVLFDGQVSAVWLMGGDELLPCFRLDNPADDTDSVILSDAPYASPGGDPFAPVRPVGRLPHLDGAVESFLALIARNTASQVLPCLDACPVVSGYTASIWREASQQVLTGITDTGAMRLSPPWDLSDYPFIRRQVAPIRYYNLHGRPDGTTWHGQLDPAVPADFTDFPPALRQVDISAAEARGCIVATESCYGGALSERSIASRFLRLGAASFLGSTAMSYGALASPISGADLLIRDFISLCAASVPLGEALLRARLAFARVMMERQGFLDAEDQKTLLSFRLLGNPTLRLSGVEPEAPVAVQALQMPMEPVEVVCAHAVPTTDAPAPPASLLEEIQELAALFLRSGRNDVPTRHATCITPPVRATSGLNSANCSVVSFDRALADGQVAVARFTLRDGHLAKTIVSH